MSSGHLGQNGIKYQNLGLATTIQYRAMFFNKVIWENMIEVIKIHHEANFAKNSEKLISKSLTPSP
jgi:hypothetical protein